jgi:hypothetical protein
MAKKIPYKKPVTSLQKVTIFLSLLALAISFVPQPFYTNDPGDLAGPGNGLYIFLLGWLLVYLNPLWLANLFYILSIGFAVKDKIHALYSSCIAALLAACFSLPNTKVDFGNGGSRVVTALGTGYKFWVASLIIMAAGTCLNYLTKKNKSD